MQLLRKYQGNTVLQAHAVVFAQEITVSFKGQMREQPQ